MPRFYRRRSHYRRRRSVRVRRRLPLNGFPATKLVRHRYCETFNVTQGVSGTPEYVVYSANSMYDPRTATGGHQPMGYDEMAAIYGHYQVVGSKITAQFTPVAITSGGSAATIPMAFICGVFRDDNSTPPVGIDSIREDGRGTWGLTTSARPWSTRAKFSAKRQYGPDWVASTLGISGSNPANQTFFILWMMNNEEGGGGGVCAVNITIEYITLWSDKLDQVPS